MSATIIVSWPFDDERPDERHEVVAGTNLAEALMAISPDRWGGLTFEVYFGTIAPDALLDQFAVVETEVKDGDVWHVRVMPGVVAGIVGAITAVIGTSVAATAAAYVIAYAITMAISMAISYAASMLLTPGKQSSNATAPDDQPTGLNALSPPRNTIRALGRVPEIYGRMRHWPDLLFPAWQEWTHIQIPSGQGGKENTKSTSEQLVTAVYCLGRGVYQVSDFKFGESDISTVNGAAYLYTPGMVLPDWVRLPRPVANLNRWEFPGLINDGTSAWYDVPGDAVSEVWIQLSAPGGLNVTASGRDGAYYLFMMVEWWVEGYRLDAAGNVVERQEWRSQLGDQTRNELRWTLKFALTPGRWRFRVALTDKTWEDYNQQASWKMFLEGILGFERMSDVHRTFTDETVLIVQARNRGDSALQNLEQFNCIVNRVLPHQEWGAAPGVQGPWSTAPLWLTAAMHTLTDPQTCNYTFEQVDWGSLLEVHAALAAVGEQDFNATLDRAMSAEEQLVAIARKARAQVFISGGLVTFARDQRRPGVSALFNRRNRLLARGDSGMGLRFPGPDEHDAVEIEWTDAANQWKKRTFTWPENSSPRNPLRIDLVGATHWHEVYRRARYEYALLRYRRRSQPLRVTEEAQLLTPFDRVAVVHPWDEGVSDGEVLEVAGLTLTLDRRLPAGLGADARIRLRAPDGRATALLPFTPAGEASVTLAAAPGFTLLVPGPDQQVGTLYNISTQDAVERATHWLVTGAEIDDAAVSLMLMDDDDRVYQEADDVPVPPSPPILQTY